MMGARRFFVKVNSDAAYRAKFIKDPIRVLRSEGIVLNARNQKELIELIATVKEGLPDLAKLPTGDEDLIVAVAKKKHPKPRPGVMMRFV